MLNQWLSPNLGICFDLSGDELQIYRPDGIKFLTYTEISQQLEQEHLRAEKLAERLRAAGIDPEQVG